MIGKSNRFRAAATSKHRAADYYALQRLIPKHGMSMSDLRSLILGVAAAPLLLSFTLVHATKHAESEAKPEPIPAPTEFITEHRGVFNGRSLSYTARAGETYIQDAEGKPSASIFNFDYLALDDGKPRPVTFLWNGGPGSDSLWLHMGSLGPKRVVVPSNAEHAGAPP